MSIWVILKSLKKNCQAKKFYSSLTGKKISDKNMNMFLRFGIHIKWKQNKRLSWVVLKTRCFILR